MKQAELCRTYSAATQRRLRAAVYDALISAVLDAARHLDLSYSLPPPGGTGGTAGAGYGDDGDDDAAVGGGGGGLTVVTDLYGGLVANDLYDMMAFFHMRGEGLGGGGYYRIAWGLAMWGCVFGSVAGCEVVSWDAGAPMPHSHLVISVVLILKPLSPPYLVPASSAVFCASCTAFPSILGNTHPLSPHPRRFSGRAAAGRRARPVRTLGAAGG